jgi:hypothetical protein
MASNRTTILASPEYQIIDLTSPRPSPTYVPSRSPSPAHTEILEESIGDTDVLASSFLKRFKWKDPDDEIIFPLLTKDRIEYNILLAFLSLRSGSDTLWTQAIKNLGTTFSQASYHAVPGTLQLWMDVNAGAFRRSSHTELTANITPRGATTIITSTIRSHVAALNSPGTPNPLGRHGKEVIQTSADSEPPPQPDVPVNPTPSTSG